MFNYPKLNLRRDPQPRLPQQSQHINQYHTNPTLLSPQLQDRAKSETSHRHNSKSLHLISPALKGFQSELAYFCIFKCEKTKFIHSYNLRSKDEVREAFWDFKALTEKQTGNKILAIFSDNEKALEERIFASKLTEEGIIHYTTQTYSPEMNGHAENS